MSKDRQPVILTTSSDHLSRATENILKRFPRGARPDKNALLNDIAAAIMPGKNWGGLLTAARDEPARSRTTAVDAALLIQSLPRDSKPASSVIGALERRITDARGIIEDPIFATEFGRDASSELINGAVLAGMVVGIFEDVGGYSVHPVPTLLLIQDGRMIAVDCRQVDAPAALTRLLLEALQRVWTTRWSDFLMSEGVRLGQVIIGPGQGVAIVPFEALGAVEEKEDLDMLNEGAIRLVFDEGASDPGDVDLISRLTELALPALVELSGVVGPVRLEVHGRERAAGLWAPIDDDIPAPPWKQGFLTRSGRGPWEADDDQSPYGSTLSYLLGEALAMVMDYHGIAFDEPLYVQATAREITARNHTRVIASDWRILSWRDGKLGGWRLDDPEKHAALRRHFEAWLESERSEFKPRQALPKNALDILTPRYGSRNNNHWDRAVGIFKQIA